MPSNGYFSFLYKILEKHQWSSLLLYPLVEILKRVHKISSFPRVLYKRGVLKIHFSKFTNKHEKQSSAGVLSKDVLTNFAKFTEKHLCRSNFKKKVVRWKPATVRSSYWRCSVKNGSKKKVFVFYLGFLSRTLTNHRAAGEGEGISLPPHYFHTLHRHLHISRVITAERSPLHIASSSTRVGNLWLQSASR